MTENGDKYKLQILDLKVCDGGVYTAKLVNSVGDTSEQTKLIVSSAFKNYSVYIRIFH